MTRPSIVVMGGDGDWRLALARALDSAPAEWSIAFSNEPVPGSLLVVPPEHDGDGVVFDPCRPEALVASITARLSSPAAKRFVVSGAGRGCGATTLALHLAAACSRSLPTCFVDLDGRWGARRRLGLPPETMTWGTAPGMDEPLPVSGGFSALPSPGGGAVPPADLLERVSSHAECIVADAPEAGSIPAGCVAASVLVVPPTDEGAFRARSLLEALHDHRWVCVSNRIGPGGETTRTELERVLGRSLDLELPCTPALRDAEGDATILSSPVHRWVRRVGALAEALLR